MRTFALLLTLAVAARAGAQQQQTATPAGTAAPNDSACAYRSCALRIAPMWNGLAVVRGAETRRVTNLNFFWPRDITPDLLGKDTTAAGVDSVAYYAKRAVALRTVGAGFTDLGALTLGVAALRALRDGRMTERDQILAGVGLGAVALSIPLQFAADGELSRAVWWHNVRFGR